MAKNPDWTLFEALSSVAVERFHQSTVDSIQIVMDNKTLTARQRYFTLRQLMQDRHKDLRNAFDGLHPRTMRMSLRFMLMHEVVTEEELSKFSPEMRAGMEEVVKQPYEIPWPDDASDS